MRKYEQEVKERRQREEREADERKQKDELKRRELENYEKWSYKQIVSAMMMKYVCESKNYKYSGNGTV